MIIINPKLGDKVLSSSTDSKLVEFKSRSEKKKGDDMNGEDESSNEKKAPCEWKFYSEKEEEFKNGFRVQLTHHKVFKKIFNSFKSGMNI